eukprot:13365753-Alexandrium_andersonii.AAC.1
MARLRLGPHVITCDAAVSASGKFGRRQQGSHRGTSWPFRVWSRMVPTRGHADSCICAAFDSTTDYFAMMAWFLRCPCLEAMRIKAERQTPQRVGCRGAMQRRSRATRW